MRFYVPEWDDAVDAGYDFEHDELSVLDRKERDLDYIWDIFDRETTPIDGVLISREQVEETKRKAERLSEYGVYDDPVLSVPEWLPTISDCGAWGYKSLPFPPYGNEEMLEFYRTLQVSVGVTIDHLVLGSGKDRGRLYLDKRAMGDGFSKSDIPEEFTETVDLMIEEWPDEWPEYVDQYEPSITTKASDGVPTFSIEDFTGDVEMVLEQLSSDPRAVYRQNDAEFRYELTLRNAKEMYELYQRDEYPFRLMVAIQGWDQDSYVSAAETVLELGYNYVGIGGVAGSPVHEVRKAVKSVGKTIKSYEREHKTRVDLHVFGFAKTEAFETIGRSGVASFDSASMLRAAWTGSGNYQLDNDKKYDAIRVRYPSNQDSLSKAVETMLRGQEVLQALRAYESRDPIDESVQDWYNTAMEIIPATREYLREHRHDEQYDESRLRDVETAFRDDFEFGQHIKSAFSEVLRDKIVKLLRKDDPKDPIPFDEYEDLLAVAEQNLDSFPRVPHIIDKKCSGSLYDHIMAVLRDYAEWIDDEGLLPEYERTLQNRPWEDCGCPICNELGIEICIFRGNDRNRRRGFHNTRRFYDEFDDKLPKILALTIGSSSLIQYTDVESYLKSEKQEFWEQTHDLPVAEVGVLHANGIQEWWEQTPESVSLPQSGIIEAVEKYTDRYQHIFVQTDRDRMAGQLSETIESVDCKLWTNEDPRQVRKNVLETCGTNYTSGADFVPHQPEISVDEGMDILVIDQCSGSKEFPEGAPVFNAEETLEYTATELIERDNVPGIAARDLYTGRQQGFIRDAIRQLKRSGHDVTRYFISAGFGLIAEDEPLPPYEVTFNSMNVGEIRDRSQQLQIKEDLRILIENTSYDVVFFTLGSDYYTSIDVDSLVQKIPPNKIGVVFNRNIVGEQFDNIVSVSARTEDAKNHDTIVIGLKGVYMQNFAKRVSKYRSINPNKIEQICRRVDDGLDQPSFEKFHPKR